LYIHPKLAAFDKNMEALFAEVDAVLEDRWSEEFPLHPARPARGSTANPEMDGLFEIAPDFTVGIGSQAGRGYLISLRIATLATVPPERREALQGEAAVLVRERLPRFFPERHLEVVRDGRQFKIVGDFSLGST
jgi:hypothetical protein